MNKKELVEYISKAADLIKAQAEKALNGILAGIEVRNRFLLNYAVE